MGKYIVAVSGGVDSIALLHMLHRLNTHEVVVAHVDHGIREDSSKDAALVRRQAAAYNMPFELVTHALGADASEQLARTVRYDFLRDLAQKYSAGIMTAHHADDVVETIAINLHRGTGWRGLATHDSDIVRPLLGVSKKKLYTYAKRHGLEWREDSTNQSEKYLRNRIRKQLRQTPEEARQSFVELRKKQIEMKKQILQEVLKLVGEGPQYSRYFFTHIPQKVAFECLRHITYARLTRPQLEKMLLAIKTIGAGKTIQLGDGLSVHFTTRNFSLSLIK